MNARVGIVVPTLGTRLTMLKLALESIRGAGNAHVILVCPRELDIRGLIQKGLIDDAVEDPGIGLPAAINAGINSMPQSILYVSWLGDDDLLESRALSEMSKLLDSDKRISAVFGRCRFIDENGFEFGTSKLGPLAPALLLIGPDLIPQPASLLRRKLLEEIGGLDERLKLAFDLDLFIRLSKVGRLKYFPEFAASYRWHSSSLSSSNKIASRRESREVRRTHLPKPVKLVSFFWEGPMELLAKIVNHLDRSSKKINT